MKTYRTWKAAGARLWRRPLRAIGLTVAAAGLALGAQNAMALTQVSSFGSNPGNLTMYKYVPSSLPSNAPLVVALHGCTQQASDYDAETGWTKYADEYKFALVLPDTNSSNNQNECFNWFERGDITRGYGEALSIKQMVDKMIADHGIDSSRVYVTGLSAGGAMTNVMLATYPDVFAGGAPVAGIPYKCATSMTDAFSCMSPGKDKTPQAWGDIVRNASSHSGPWPKVSIWQGTDDYTVKAVNATETMEQWTNVNGVDQRADVEDTIAGYPHKVYKDANGDPRVETIFVTGMGHGTPVDPGTGEKQCGQAGAYILDVDVCSSYYIAKFWGLDNSDTQAPDVSITSPSDGAGVSGNVLLQAGATDNVGVTKVEFFVDGKLHKADTSSPYEVYWDTSVAANGNHSLMAKAFDAAGNVGTSSQISVTVSGGVEDTTPPSVNLTYPSNGDTVWGTIKLAADASDDFGVSKVEFFVDGVSIGTGTPSKEAGPWTLEWNTTTVADGSHAISVKAFDAKGNNTLDDDTTVTVNQNVLALDETFSDRDGDGDYFDAGDWSGGFTAASDNATVGPAGSQSAYGYASSGINCSAGTKTKTLAKNVTLGDNPQLSYKRKLDLAANVNTSTSASFAVTVDGTAVDSKSVTYANYSESSWTERTVDLSAYANATVTLALEVSAYSNVCMEVYAKAWVDDVKVGNPQQDEDTAAPSVNLTSPSNGATVSGTVDIAVDASDDTGVSKVEFYVDGNLLGTDQSSPYAYTWNTGDIEDGSHSLMAKAYDAAGNVGSDNDVSVTVDNAGSGGGDDGGTGTTTTVSLDNNNSYDGYVKAYADGSGAEVGGYESWYGLAIGRGSDSKFNRTVLSFDTSSIPDGATVTKAYVTVRYSTGSGDPWSDPTGNELVIDVKTGCFGGCSIESGDYSAAADAAAVANIVKFTSGTQNSSTFSAAGLSAINKTGTTQLKLRFSQNQSSTNYLFIENGSYATLHVEYQ